MKRLTVLMLLILVLLGCRPAHRDAVVFSTWGSQEEIDTLHPILSAFTRQSGVKVEVIHIPEDYNHKLRLMIAARRTPDVMFMESQYLPGFARRGVFEDLKPWLARPGKPETNEYYPQVLDAMSWKGTRYGIPRDLSNLVVYYNRDLFDAAGVGVPRPGWSWDQMLVIAQRLTRRPDVFGIGIAPYPLYWYPFLWSGGGDVMDAEMRRCTLDEPQAVEALQFFADLTHRHHVSPTEEEVGNARASQLFVQGKLGMYVGGRWVVPGFRKKIAFRWDVVPFPKGPAGSVVDADASGWCIAKNSRRKEDAWKLVSFLGDRWSIERFTESGLIVPSRPDVADSAAFAGNGPPEHGEAFFQAIEGSRPTRTPPSYQEIHAELMEGLEPVWRGKQRAEEVVPAIARRIDALLKEAP